MDHAGDIAEFISDAIKLGRLGLIDRDRGEEPRLKQIISLYDDDGGIFVITIEKVE